jgi:hypothetical protein
MMIKRLFFLLLLFCPCFMLAQDTVRVRRIQKIMRHVHYGPGLTLQHNFDPSATTVALNYFWAHDYRTASLTLDADFGYAVLPGLSLNTYTNFKNTDWYVAPNLGIGTYAVKVFYAYNISLNDAPNFHAIGIVLRPQILFNAWINADSGLSQFDVRKKRKKKKVRQ